MNESQIAYEQIESKALAGNPLGDPHRRILPVYLPPGYAASQERYPVVFLLAGFAGRGVNLLHESAWEETIQQRMDRLIREGRCRPMLLALPDCFTRYGGSQYLNSSATGNYADYLLELVAEVQQRFRTIPDRDFRGIAGISSGGFGALRMGMLHPETFGCVADHSGDKYFELCYKPDFPRFVRGLGRYRDLAQFLAAPEQIRPRGGDFFPTISLAAMAACYSPNPSSPLGFDLPVDPQTCELRPEVWRRWEEHDPVLLVSRHAAALKSLRLLFLDCGTRDEYNLLYGCRILRQRLLAAGIPHEYQEFDDGHRSLQYRYDLSLTAIGARMPR